MGSITYREAETHILSVYFQGQPEGFGPFYVGLGNGAAPMSEDTTLASIALREVVGPGYTRAMILRDGNNAAGWQIFGGDAVQSPELVFYNNGLTCWNPIDFAFLTLSPFGSADPGLLVAAIDFKNSTILKPGERFKFHFRFRQTTYNFNYQRLQCGEASIVGTASILPSMFGNSLSGIATTTAETDLFYAVDPPDITGVATIIGAGGVEIQPYPVATTGATASTTADAVCFP